VSRLPDGITEWAMQVRVLCPDCQSPMHFAHGDYGQELMPVIKTCWCPVIECSEHVRVWNIDLMTGIAQRMREATSEP
jgi:hypothetical protein